MHEALAFTCCTVLNDAGLQSVLRTHGYRGTNTVHQTLHSDTVPARPAKRVIYDLDGGPELNHVGLTMNNKVRDQMYKQ